MLSESIDIDRSPDDVYDMISDVTRMGEWSPVCVACWWDEGDGPREGSWFTGRNETAPAERHSGSTIATSNGTVASPLWTDVFAMRREVLDSPVGARRQTIDATAMWTSPGEHST